jgi:hypothetical protein
MANTIDDASPAVQYGKKQIYLGVKAAAACQVGVKMLEAAEITNTGQYLDFAKKGYQTIELEGWLGDHYAVTLTRTKDGLFDPWSGKPQTGELEGWDAYHIYTANGLALLDMVGCKGGLNEQHLKTDLFQAVNPTLSEYGCRHSSYTHHKTLNDSDSSKPDDYNPEKMADGVEVVFTPPSQVGWVSMNMLRDIAAGYRGLDLFSLADRYWNWQTTTNSQKLTQFFETFYGNNLHCYPRGVAVFGYLDSVTGFRYDAVDKIYSFSPIRTNLTIPLFLFADWKQGTAPTIKTFLKEGILEYRIDGIIG